MQDIRDYTISIVRSSIYKTAIVPLLMALLEAEHHTLEDVQPEHLQHSQGRAQMLRELLALFEAAMKEPGP